MKKLQFKDTEITPLLIKNIFKNDNSRNYVNIGPLINALDVVKDGGESNPIQVLSDFIKSCTRIIGTVDITTSFYYEEKGCKEDLLWTLFVLEDGLAKCTEVNL